MTTLYRVEVEIDGKWTAAYLTYNKRNAEREAKARPGSRITETPA